MTYLWALVFMVCNDGIICTPSSVALYTSVDACNIARDQVQEDEETACVIILPKE